MRLRGVLGPVRAWTAVAVVVVLGAVAVAHAASRLAEDDAPPSPSPSRGAAPAAAPPPLPALDEHVAHGPRTLARRLRETAVRLDEDAARWRRDDGLRGTSPPTAVTRLATYESRMIAALAARPGLGRAVLRRLPARLAHRVAPEVRALRELRRLHALSQRRPGPPPKVRLGPPAPAAALLRHYRAAQRRFGVGWHVLAAVNYVESRFGRYRNESISGARGPMQFMPATWRAYGLGGDVRRPRDAILGAANLLRANGAPRDYRRALYHYNPSSLYVRTVRMYANRMARDPRAYPILYAREVVR
ncbi:MAG TPA: lytic transglycosylase domain-containing protein [Baekduia sp.]|nr:lytic transglycosylase domain-containing protein [Baekduia sp.]